MQVSIINIYQHPVIKCYHMSVLPLLIPFSCEISYGSIGCCVKLPFSTQNLSKYLWMTKLLPDDFYSCVAAELLPPQRPLCSY